MEFYQPQLRKDPIGRSIEVSHGHYSLVFNYISETNAVLEAVSQQGRNREFERCAWILRVLAADFEDKWMTLS